MASQRTIECPTCGNTDYNLADGLYYCTLCQTQSQDVVEIDYSEALTNFDNAAARLLIKEKKKAKESKVHEEEIPLPPYALYEAYAIIFDQLASILIRLGLPDTVKEALFRLYALYLRRRGEAFVENVDPDDAASPNAPFRPKFLVVHHKIIAERIAKRSRPTVELELDEIQSKLPQNDDQVNDAYLDFLGGPSAQEPEEVSTAPPPTTTPPATTTTPATTRKRRKRAEATTESASDSEMEDGNPEEGPDVRTKNVAFATRLQANLIVPFLYLACLAVSPQQICLSDLMRWTKENILPVSEAFKLLPDRLKHPEILLHFAYVKGAIPHIVTSAVYRRTIWLANYIGYTPNIKFDTDILLAKFAKDLNLSKHFLPRARIILRAVEFINSAFRFSPLEHVAERSGKDTVPITPPEVAAVAVLIVALKLTFGLDDHCEYVLSRLAAESNEASDSGNCFSFTRWQLQYRMRSAVAEGESIDRVLSRSWIDQRETWLHGVMLELESIMESDPRSHFASRAGSRAYDVKEKSEDREEPEQDTADVDVDALRNLFNDFTPFSPSNGPLPIEKRRLLHPLSETVDQLPSPDHQRSFDPSNVDIFKHDFFKDSLSFLSDHAVKKRIKEMIRGLPGVEVDGKIKLTPFEKIFPCARSNAKLGRAVISDFLWGGQDCVMENMVENEKEYEVSSNLAFLLKTCKNRLQEDMWVLFRAVQKIEVGLEVYLEKPEKLGLVLGAMMKCF